MKMNVYLFTALCYLLLFILMCNTLCEQTSVDAQAPLDAKDPFELFKDDTIKDAKTPGGSTDPKPEDVNVKNYDFPVLVSTKENVFALAGVERADGTGKRYIDILTKYVQNKDDLSDNGWTPQFAVQHNVEETNKSVYFVKGLLAVANKEKVYLLFLNYTKKEDSALATNPEWEFKFAVATINKGSETQIVWNEHAIDGKNVNEKLKTQFTNDQAASFSFSGSAFLMEENKMVFALVLGDSKKKVFAFMQLNKKTETNFETEFVYTEILGDCYPYVFPWKEKTIMIVGKCSNNNGKQIKELSKVGQSWEKSTGAFSRQWKFLKDKKHFTTTKITGESVLLFTEERTKTNGEQDKDVNLWMSDGNRTTKIDVITTIKSTETFTASILRTDKGLFALYQKCETEKPGSTEINKICFTNLKKHFQKITDTVNAWNQINDEEIKKFYKDTDKENNLFSADGLVGFLSGTKETNKWKDKCLNVDATFYENSKKTADNGFKFTGQGAGAQWLVGEQKEDQPYDLKYSGFTLVATVTVGNVASGSDNSVLGVSLADKPKKGIGLWCTTEGKWVVKKKDGGTIAQSSAVECKHGESYYMALILNNNGDMISVYVNGQKLSMLKTEELKVGPSENIKHFYFGVDKGEAANTDVTIENVLLYNLPFEENKINELKPKETIVADAQQTTQPGNGQTPKSDKSTTQTEKPASPSVTKDKEEKQPSPPPPTTEDSAVRAGVVGVLCFMLFGVFTLLGRYVY